MTKSTPITEDWFLFGALTGFGATLVKDAFNRTLDRMGAPMIDFSSLASGLIMGKKAKLLGAIPNRPVNKAEWAIGFLANVVYGTLFGVSSAAIYTKTPPGNELAKGVLCGAGWWAVNLTIGNQFKIDGLTKVKPAQLGRSFVAHVLYGGIQGWAFGLCRHRLATQPQLDVSDDVRPNEFRSYSHIQPLPYNEDIGRH